MEPQLAPPGLEAAIEQLLLTRIPLAAQMAVRVLRLDEHVLELGAPLEPNRNHMGTGFAGSLLAVASLAGWSAVVTMLGSTQVAHVVMQELEASFIEPVTADFRVRVHLPEAEARTQFLSAFRRYGRGRVSVRAEIIQAERIAARTESRFVALRA